MPRFAKWLIDAAPDAPVDQVARKALTTRLRAVAWYLDAVIGGEDESEAIHQLRIWTRRSDAALRLFAPALADRPARRLRKILRKLRRKAGAVRDCEIQRQQIQDSADRPPRHICSQLDKQHRHARQKLKSLRRRVHKADRLQRRSNDVLEAIAWPKRHSSREAPPFAPWCRQQLAALGQLFFESAAIQPADDRQLHELRKAGKRLRYALELSPAALPPRVHRRLYDELSRLQDRLGAVCDRLVSVEQFRDWESAAHKRKHREQLAMLLSQEDQRLAAARQQFHRWWSGARRARLKRQWEAATAA